ncbi:hypothetical protein LWM68_34525 [Niabella sp. W65]|nr:hypothetical protein [Niabella sp. W65]MCH7367428.1 hypothetical protein [Niabella sp. W65]
MCAAFYCIAAGYIATAECSATTVTRLANISDVPVLGFMLPLIGLFIAPIYPLLNSTVLSHLPKNLHSPMSGLIIIFSALGGTLGSRIVGILFGEVGGVKAFYVLLIPMVLLIISVLVIQRIIRKKSQSVAAASANVAT